MKRQLSFFMLLFLCVNSAWSQTRTVSGRVIADSTKHPLNGVSVKIKGSSSGTATDQEGKYSITLPDGGSPVLVFSSIGYATREIAVGQKNVIDVSLETTF